MNGAPVPRPLAFGPDRRDPRRQAALRETVAALAEALRAHPRVLLYLSSGPVLPQFEAMPYDLVLLVDRQHRTGHAGRTFRLGMENAHALRLLQALGVKVDCLLAVCDGCREGGNPDCSYGPAGLGPLLPVLRPETLWITDHARPHRKLGFEGLPAELPEGSWLPRGRYGDLRALRMVWNQRPPVEHRLGSARLRILHDTVFHHLPDLDALLLPPPGRLRHGIRSSFGPLPRGLAPFPPVTHLSQAPSRTILEPVRDLARSGVRRLGVLPCFRPHAESVVQELLDHGLGGLEAITFFHLDRSDFAALRRRARA